MIYVCKSLTWWHNAVLAVELELERSLLETGVSSSRGTMGHHPIFLTVPIQADVRQWNGLPREDVYEQFMRKLTRSLTLLGMELQQKEQISTALTSLVSSVQNWPSTLGSHAYTTIWITE